MADDDLTDEQLLHLRQRLDEREAELRETLEQREAAARPVELDQTTQGRLSRMDAMQQQAMASNAANRARQELAQIRAAKLRLDSGDFGACEDCGEIIAFARLERNPCHTLCVACASARETT